MTTSWRRLPFFSQRELGAPALLHAGITACCSLDGGGVALADVHGVCHVLDGALDPHEPWRGIASANPV